jgi:hypothetical protein
MPTTIAPAPMIATQRRPIKSDMLPVKGHTQACRTVSRFVPAMSRIESTNQREEVGQNEPDPAICSKVSSKSPRGIIGSLIYRLRQCPGRCTAAHLRKGRQESAIRSTLYDIVSGITTFDAGETSSYRKPWQQGSSCERSSFSAPPHGSRHHLQCVRHSSRSSWGGLGRARSCGLARHVPCQYFSSRHAKKTPCCLDWHGQHAFINVHKNRLT